jgi:hypothetical protein
MSETDPTDHDMSHLLKIHTSAAGYDVTNNIDRWRNFGGLELAGLVEVSNCEDTMSGLRSVTLTPLVTRVAEAMLIAAQIAIAHAERCRESPSDL